MNSVQKVFNKVISAGFYSEHKDVLMCHALEKTQAEGLISIEDWKLAQKEIKDYLKAFGSLGGKLMHANLAHDFNARLSIYENWANKPVIETKGK